MQIKCFKDLDCWKKTRELVRLIYDITKKDSFSRDFGLRDQIQRAAVSSMANTAEGFGTSSDREFIRFISYSIRSIYEVQSHLFVALDLNYINKEKFEEVESLSNDCINLCKGLIRYLKNRNSST